MANAATINADRLAVLQNLVKRDPAAYSDEFKLQHASFLATLEIFKLSPSSDPEAFKALIHFLAHTAPCYAKADAGVAALPTQLIGLLTEHADVLSGPMRRAIAQALMLLRNRGLIAALPLLRVFFDLFRVRDKSLRELVFQHIVHDIRAVNKERKDEATNRALQTHMYAMLASDSDVVAKRSLDVMVELYRRQVWTDARTVNVIAQALTSPRPKLLVTALKFFLGVGPDGGEHAQAAESDDDSDGGDNADAEAGAAAPQAMLTKAQMRQAEALHAHSKQTRRRRRQTERLIASMKKAAKRGAAKGPVFPAIQMLNDPQGLAEKMFTMLRGASASGTMRFEVRLLMMNLITRLVGQHRLLLLPLYSYLQRYLAAHQANVTQVLAYLIQACHDLVPPEELMPVVKAIANNFIADRCPPEVMQVGLNALREVFAHSPVVLEEPGMADLVQDLVAYKKYKNKGVVASARSLLNLIRDVYPSLLRRRDRGRDASIAAAADPEAAAALRPTSYGAHAVAAGVEGSDLLALALARKAARREERLARGAQLKPVAGTNGAAADEADGEGSDGSDGESEDDNDSYLELGLSDAEEDEAEAGPTHKGPHTAAAPSAASASSAIPLGSGGSALAGLMSSDEWAALEKKKPARAMSKRKRRRAELADKPDAASDDDSDVSGMLEDLGDDGSVEAEEEPVPDDEAVAEDGVSDADDSNDDDGDDGADLEEDDNDEQLDGEADSGNEDDDEDDKMDEDEVEEEQQDDAAQAHAGVKRRRASSSAGSEGDDLPAAVTAGRRTAGSVRSGISKSASVAAALSSRIAGVTGPGATRLEAVRVLTPKDFARIKALRRALAARGMNKNLTAEEILAMATNGSGLGLSEAGSDAAIKRRRKGRPGYNPKEGEEEDDEDEANQLAMPGTSYAPPVASMDPLALEANETKKKRRAAVRVAEVIEAKTSKYEGKRVGGGLTNREKARFKNFVMLRKSGNVVGKVKRSLQEQRRAVQSKLKGDNTANKRSKQRRRRA